MPLFFVLDEKEALQEFREALESGDTERVIERHDDAMLLLLLRHRRNSWGAAFRDEAITLLTLGFQIFSGVAWTHRDDSESKRKSAKAWQTISQRVEVSSLNMLLAAHQLNIKELSSAIQAGMIQRLNRATNEELELLTAMERRELVRFALRQLRPQWVGYPVLDAAQRQAATLGYLALATLKQPGAERPNRTGMNATHTHLSKAIDEYLTVVAK